jgi:hypothetical protein
MDDSPLTPAGIGPRNAFLNIDPDDSGESGI